MTDIWDELWSRENFTQIIEVGPNEVVPDKTVVTVAWLKEVKAEGDRLKDQIEAVRKWNEEHGGAVGMYQANWDELDEILEGLNI